MKRILLIALVVFAILVLAFVLILPTILETDFVQSEVQSQIHRLFPKNLNVGKISIGYFPFPHIRVSDIRFKQAVADGSDLSLEAASVDITPDLFSLLFRRVELSRLSLNGGTLNYRFKDPRSGAVTDVPIHDLKVTARDVKTNRHVKLTADGRLFASSVNTHVKVSYDAPRENPWWEGASLSLELNAADLDMSQVHSVMFPSGGGFVSGGKVNLTFHADKDRDESVVRLSVKKELRDVALKPYGRSDSVSLGQLTTDAEATFDLATNLLSIQDASLESPLAEGVLKGQVDFAKPLDREGIDLELSLAEINAAEVARFLTVLGADVPLSLDGNARLSIIARGGLDQLAVKFEVTMTETDLRVPEVFEKAKTVPFEVSGEVQVGSKKEVKGDIDFFLADAAGKGNIVYYDIERTEYEFTFLTNKFSLKHVPELFPAARAYRFDGLAKWLLNLKGNAADGRIDHLRTHLTLEKASVVTPEGITISEADGLFDFQERDLSIKDFKADWQGLPITAQAQSYGVWPSIFSYQLTIGNGTVDGKGALDRDAGAYLASTDVQVSNLPLGAILSRVSGKSPMDGVGFLSGSFRTAGSDPAAMLSALESQGNIRILNGTLNTIDLMGSLGTMQQLLVLAAESRGATKFASLDTNYTVARQEISLSEGVLTSDDMSAEFNGTVSPERGYDIPIEILLSPELSSRLVAGIGDNQIVRIPAHLDGPFEAPHLSVTDSLVGNALSSLVYKFTDGRLGKNIFGQTDGQDSPFLKTLPTSTDPAAGTPDPDLAASDAPPPSQEEELIRAGIGLLSGLLGEQQAKK